MLFSFYVYHSVITKWLFKLWTSHLHSNTTEVGKREIVTVSTLLSVFSSSWTAITKCCRLGGLYNRSLYLAALESWKSKLKLPVDLTFTGIWWEISSWLLDYCLFTVCLYGLSLEHHKVWPSRPNRNLISFQRPHLQIPSNWMQRLQIRIWQQAGDRHSAQNRKAKMTQAYSAECNFILLVKAGSLDSLVQGLRRWWLHEAHFYLKHY